MRESSHGENSNLWLENYLFELRSKKIINQLKKISRPEAVADFGCGYNAKLLNKIIFLFPGIKQAVGMDLSVNAALSSEKIKFIKTDLNLRLPLSDNFFDVIICSAVIEHLNGYRQALSEIYRLLKPGGYFILTSPTPRAKKLLEFLAFKLKILDGAEIADHEKYFSEQELKKMLKELNFSEIKIKPFQLGFNNLLTAGK